MFQIQSIYFKRLTESLINSKAKRELTAPF